MYETLDSIPSTTRKERNGFKVLPPYFTMYFMPNTFNTFIIINVFFFLLQVSSKDEDFLDLSVDVEQNTSITHCLR